MKKLTLFIFIILLSAAQYAFAQDDTHEKNKKHKGFDPASCRKAYMGFSLGINNPTGIIGLDIDIPIATNISIGSGFGPSTWGTKMYIDSRYYLKPCHRGLAFGIGITHNTGRTNYTTNLETIYGSKEDVTLNLHAQTNMFMGVYYFWTIGKRYNRLYAEAGYSVPFATYQYTEIQGYPLSINGENAVKTISPGGFMLGFGFSFGVH